MIRLLRWLLLLLVLGVFGGMAAANWGEAPVDFVLPDGTVLAVRLPLLLIAAFVAGWLPPWLWHLAHGRLTRRPAPAASPSSSARVPEPPPAAGTAGLCDQAQPIIVPPAA